MTHKFRSVFAGFLTIMLAVSFVFAQDRKPVPTSANPLISSLPASDAVVSFHAQKFLNNVLPQLLGADSPQVARINTHLDQIKTQTGLDLRQFETAAAGIKYKQISATEIDFEPVILVSGKFNPGAMLALVKLAVKGKYREEPIGGRTVLVLQVKEIMTETAGANSKPSFVEKKLDSILKTFSGELAVGALNDSTLAIGTVARVRETFSGASALNPELRSSVESKPGAVLSFGGNVPQGLSRMLGLDNEEIGKTFDSIKLVSGSLDMNAGNASLMLAGKTYTTEQAQSLEDTALGLQMLGKALIGGVKGSAQEKDMYNRLIDSAKITRAGNQVQINLLIPQSDLNILARKL